MMCGQQTQDLMELSELIEIRKGMTDIIVDMKKLQKYTVLKIREVEEKLSNLEKRYGTEYGKNLPYTDTETKKSQKNI